MGENRRLRGNEYRSTLVCVDGYEHQIMSGRFYNAFQSDGEGFGSWLQFLLQMERMLNQMDFPQAFSLVRSFSDPPEQVVNAPPGDETVRGRLATFEIKVLFRQNASWQGCVTWLEGGREESFRSVLELAVLMDSALYEERRREVFA